jgi:membrane protease YdiL (CAAX protease family)
LQPALSGVFAAGLPATIILAFGALTLAFAALWAGPAPGSPQRRRLWTFPFAIALVGALAGGIVDVRGVLVLLVYAVACRAASVATGTAMRAVALVLLLLVCGSLMLHVLPGFHNPVVIDAVVLSPGGVPYTKYLNFDKAVAGLFLLGLYAPALVIRDKEPADAGPYVRNPAALWGFSWRFAVLAAAIIALSLALGFVRWDPKAPAWFPLWALSLLCFTVLPEEALFRGVVQTSLERRLGGARRATIVAVTIAATLFGLAHAGGGPTYVVLATVAGAGYGWIYAATRSLGAAILAHFGVDAIHFLFFTYPALALQ